MIKSALHKQSIIILIIIIIIITIIIIIIIIIITTEMEGFLVKWVSDQYVFNAVSHLSILLSKQKLKRTSLWTVISRFWLG